jgi:hypothetical protein
MIAAVASIAEDPQTVSTHSLMENWCANCGLSLLVFHIAFLTSPNKIIRPKNFFIYEVVILDHLHCFR